MPKKGAKTPLSFVNDHIKSFNYDTECKYKAMQRKEINRHAILVTDKATGNQVLFTSIRMFVQANPTYSEHTIYNYTSRKKKPFEDDKIILEKIPFFKNDNSKSHPA